MLEQLQRYSALWFGQLEHKKIEQRSKALDLYYLERRIKGVCLIRAFEMVM